MPPPHCACYSNSGGLGFQGWYAALRDTRRNAARRGHLGHAVRRRASHRVFRSSRVSFLSSPFRKSWQFASTSIALDIELDVPRRRERQDGGLIRSRDSFARLRSPTFLFSFSLTDRLNFISIPSERISRFFFVSRSIIGRRAKGVVTIRIVASLRFPRRSTVRVSTRWPCCR